MLDAILVSTSMTLPCAPSLEVEIALNQYRERVFATATTAQGFPMQIRVNADTGTYTVLVFLPDNLTCIVAGGKEFASSQRRIVPGQPL